MNNGVIVEKVINIDQNSRGQTPWSLFVGYFGSVSKFSTESVGSRRELVVNTVHTADTDATQLDSSVASAVCIGHYGSRRFVWSKSRQPLALFLHASRKPDELSKCSKHDE